MKVAFLPSRWVGTDMHWITAVAALRREREPGVLVTVLAVRGHAPREAGAKMVVGRSRCWGSVGGGNLEQSAVLRARELIAAGAPPPAARTSPLPRHAPRPPGARRGAPSRPPPGPPAGSGGGAQGATWRMSRGSLCPP